MIVNIISENLLSSEFYLWRIKIGRKVILKSGFFNIILGGFKFFVCVDLMYYFVVWKFIGF